MNLKDAYKFYVTYLSSELSYLRILLKKACDEVVRRQKLLSAADTQFHYLLALADTIENLDCHEAHNIFNECVLLIKENAGFDQVSVLFVLIETAVGKASTNFNQYLTPGWAHIYASDNHALMSRADKTGLIISVNQRFSLISGYDADELIGEDHAILNSGLHGKGFFKTMWQTILAGQTWNGTVCNRTKKGEEYWVESSISPVFCTQGNMLYFVSIRTDITKVKRVEEEALKVANRLKLSQQFANIGTWEWQIETGELWWSEKIAPMFGGEHSEITTSYESFTNAIHENDREEVQLAIQECVEHGTEYDIEHRVVWPDGQVRWLREKGDVTRNRQGQPVKMLGAVQDITEKKYFETMLVKQQQLLKLLHATTIHYLATKDFEYFAHQLLKSLLELTDARQGIIAEVVSDGNSDSYLKIHAMSKVLEYSSERTSVEKTSSSCLAPACFEQFYVETLKTKKLFISETPILCSDNKNFVANNYMGIPVLMNGEIYGMFILVNRDEGFNHQLYEFLGPLISTFGSMIFSKRLQEQEQDRILELEEAKTKAEESNLAKSSFLSSMSHELRTPLNSILGFSELMTMSDLTSGQSEQLDEISKSGHHLLHLINDILDLARIDSGYLALSLEKVELIGLVHDVIRMLKMHAHQKNITVTEELDGTSMRYVFADYTRLKQVVLNYLSNAIKYNKVQGSVVIRIGQTSIDDVLYYRISVEDTGIGIPKRLHHKVFEPFNRLGHEAKSIEGTGIGLAISKSIAEAMGGYVGFSSMKGVGSEFWVDVPVCSEVDENIVKNEMVTIDNVSKGSVAEPFSYKRSILYIEDNVANMKLISGIVNTIPNVELTIAVNAEDGIEMAKKLVPDIILLDINLPGMSGIEALPLLQAIPALSKANTVIYALSANAMQDDINKALETGFDGYFTKPINVLEFIELFKGANR